MSALLWIIVVLVVLIVIGVIVFLYITKPRTTVPQTTSGFLQPCSSSSPCTSGLVCQGICKQDIGQPCTQLSDCVSSATVCDGTCMTGAYGGLNQPCPCNSPTLSCVSTNGSPPQVCLGLSGQACQQNTDCISGQCISGQCSAGKTVGLPCTVGQCASGLQCSIVSEYGFCQPTGEISGTQGAYCILGQEWPPTSNNSGPGCGTGLGCINNTCQLATSTLGGICSSDLPCVPPLVCSDEENGGTCIYPGNSCPSDVCIAGYTCNTSTQVPVMTPVITTGTCLGQAGQPCSSASTCITTNGCTSTSLVSWSDSQQEWLNEMASPSGITRLSNYNGVIYASTPNGLYSSTSSGWTQLIPSSIVYQDILYTFIQGAIGQNGTVYIVLQSISTFLFTLGTLLNKASSSQTSATLGTLLNKASSSQTSATLGTSGIAPFNVTNTPNGTQYSTTGTQLNIQDFDVSSAGDVIILSNGTLYVKAASQTQYTVTNISGTIPRFYSDVSNTSSVLGPQRVPLVAGTSVTSTSSGNFGYISSNTLKFSGALSSLSLPSGASAEQVVDWSIVTDPTLGIGELGVYMILQGTLPSGQNARQSTSRYNTTQSTPGYNTSRYNTTQSTSGYNTTQNNILSTVLNTTSGYVVYRYLVYTQGSPGQQNVLPGYFTSSSRVTLASSGTGTTFGVIPYISTSTC